MKLSISSPITLVLDPPHRKDRAREIAIVAQIEPVAIVPAATEWVVSGKRAHRVARVHRRRLGHGGKSVASA